MRKPRPDLLTLSIGVECRRGDVGTAYGDAGRSSAAITAALRGHGVADPHITTSGLNVRAEVNWQEGRGQVVLGLLGVQHAQCPDHGICGQHRR